MYMFILGKNDVCEVLLNKLLLDSRSYHCLPRFNDNSPWTTALRTIAPHDVPPRTIPSRTFTLQTIAPWIILPWTTTTRTIALHEIPPRTITSPDFCLPDNCTWIIPPWKTPPRTVKSYEIPPGQLLPRNFAPQAITPEWLPLGHCPQDNYPMKFPCI